MLKRGTEQMSTSYENGKQARIEGKKSTDNPFIIGYTKLGSPKLSDEGIEWEQGFNSIGRIADKKEVQAANSVEVSRFRRKANRYYTR
jgi:hypothetical protein